MSQRTVHRNIQRHECRCPRSPDCHKHGAEEWGGGEPDKCAPHNHSGLDVPALARALHANHDDYRCGGPQWHEAEARILAARYEKEASERVPESEEPRSAPQEGRAE